MKPCGFLFFVVVAAFLTLAAESSAPQSGQNFLFATSCPQFGHLVINRLPQSEQNFAPFFTSFPHSHLKVSAGVGAVGAGAVAAGLGAGAVAAGLGAVAAGSAFPHWAQNGAFPCVSFPHDGHTIDPLNGISSLLEPAKRRYC